MVHIRPVRTDELAVIIATAGQSALEQLVGRDQPEGRPEAVAAAMRKMYENVLRAPLAALLMAEGENPASPAGHILLLPQPNGFTGAPELVVMDIYTQPAWRGKGVGKAMLAHAQEYGWRLGCLSIGAQVALHNQPSLRMFLTSGFAPERVVVGKRL